MRGIAGFGPVVAVVMALAAAACAPPEPPSSAAPGPGTGAGPGAGIVSGKSSALVAAPPANSEVGKLLIGTPPKDEIAGERLNLDRLRAFYARHGFARVWTPARQAAADALTDTVLNARDHGLAPELFHADLLRTADTLPPLDRELMLSDAFLAYADALARGVVPLERRQEDETLTPGPVDIAAAFDAALDTPDPAAAVEALAPQTPTYRVLRAALVDLRVGKGGKEATAHWHTIEVNLERERWLPRHLPGERIWVNVADQQLTMFRDGEPAISMKVVVGQNGPGLRSPEFQVPIDAVWFNPPWTIPDDIAKNEILPKAKGDPTYLARHNLTLLPSGLLQQKAGPNSALWPLMFDMNNRFDVYLHATPSKELFLRADRRISHGCIRVEKPRELAALVMQQPVEDIDRAIATGDTSRTLVPKPVPVIVGYETAFADGDGKLQFRPDIYDRDAEIWQALAPPARVMAAR